MLHVSARRFSSVCISHTAQKTVCSDINAILIGIRSEIFVRRDQIYKIEWRLFRINGKCIGIPAQIGLSYAPPLHCLLKLLQRLASIFQKQLRGHLIRLQESRLRRQKIAADLRFHLTDSRKPQLFLRDLSGNIRHVKKSPAAGPARKPGQNIDHKGINPPAPVKSTQDQPSDRIADLGDNSIDIQEQQHSAHLPVGSRAAPLIIHIDLLIKPFGYIRIAAEIIYLGHSPPAKQHRFLFTQPDLPGL